ncbi:hypothetical protein GCM10027275_20870 [Rhabdobacter roseus]|uniref:Uncharacterized protein YbjQ (UPF0145 family) n=1 Tax=Rhabdobacter roseus TaxID=1655419 RepID=A0A840TVN7_9BACT|nr:hypothetical protein [Rhabdobacter roseus]MBB5284020.1 uncharacterized protein YbjQ (UPF0145 family) [Rhabdobacter roseus]
MVTKKILGKLLLLGTLGIALGCFRPAIPLRSGPAYPIDLFYENQAPDRPFSELQWVEITRDEALNERQQKNSSRMLYRGNDAEGKQLLTAQLVLKAQKLGADALINVQYKYYTSATSEGYTMRGLAVQYRGQ